MDRHDEQAATVVDKEQELALDVDDDIDARRPAGLQPHRQEGDEAGGGVDFGFGVQLEHVANSVFFEKAHTAAQGASVIITGSTAGMTRGTTDNPNMGPGGRGYGWSKRVIIEYVEEMSLALADRMIRVNAIHPGYIWGDSVKIFFEMQAEELARKGNTAVAVAILSERGFEGAACQLMIRFCPVC